MPTAPIGLSLRQFDQAPTFRSPYTKSFVITPSDTEEITTQAIMLNADGNVRVELWIDSAPVNLSLKGGVIYPLGVKRFHNTGSDDTLVVIGLL